MVCTGGGGAAVACLYCGLIGLFIAGPMMHRLRTVQFGSWIGGTPRAIGHAIFTDYLLPFEVSSVLVLIAILGAVVLARKEIDLK